MKQIPDSNSAHVPQPERPRPGGKVRVLVVDDSPDFLSQAMGFLAELEGVELAGAASSGPLALELLERGDADLVLMDLAMPEMNGLEATRLIVDRSEPPLVVIVSMHDDAGSRVAALEAGARGFIPKSELVESLPVLLDELFPEARARARSSGRSSFGWSLPRLVLEGTGGGEA